MCILHLLYAIVTVTINGHNIRESKFIKCCLLVTHKKKKHNNEDCCWIDEFQSNFFFYYLISHFLGVSREWHWACTMLGRYVIVFFIMCFVCIKFFIWWWFRDAREYGWGSVYFATNTNSTNTQSCFDLSTVKTCLNNRIIFISLELCDRFYFVKFSVLGSFISHVSCWRTENLCLHLINFCISIWKFFFKIFILFFFLFIKFFAFELLLRACT